MMEHTEGNVGPTAAQRGCPPPDVVAAIAGDALPPELRDTVAAHVASCAACQALAADLTSLAEAELPANLEARVLAYGARTARWLLPVAAVLVTAAGLGLWWSVRAPRHAAQPPVQMSANRPAPAPAPSPVWTIEKPALTLPAASVLVMRGADPAGAALAAAVEPYRRNDFRAAAERLATFTAAHPDSPDGWFYLGASRLLLNDNTGARTALETAASLGASASHPELEWLLATSEARTGGIDRARARLITICGTNGPERDRACAALGVLK